MRIHPLVLIAGSFAFGSLLALDTTGRAAIVVSACIAAAGVAIFRNSRYLVALCCACALLGYVRAYQTTIRADSDVSRLAPARATVEGVVDSDVSLSAPPAPGKLLQATFTIDTSRVRAISEARYRRVTGRIQAHARVGKIVPEYGDAISITGYLDRPPTLRNPGGVNEEETLGRRGIYATMISPRPEMRRVSRVATAGGNVVEWGVRVKESVRNVSSAVLSPLQSAVLRGVLLGDRADIPEDLRDDFDRTGTAHILATAGLHIGIAAMLLFALLSRLWVPYRGAAFVTAVVLAFYAVIASGRPPVVRAVTVADVYLIALIVAREPNPWTALALAALIQMVPNPALVQDPGFQMSFATVATIVALMPVVAEPLAELRSRSRTGSRARRILFWLLEWLCASAALTIAAQIGVAPFAAAYFNSVSIVAVPANLCVVPAVLLVMAIGLLAAVTGLIAPAAAAMLYKLMGGPLNYIAWMARRWADLFWSSYSVVRPPVVLICLYYAVVLGLAWRWRRGEAAESKDAVKRE